MTKFIGICCFLLTCGFSYSQDQTIEVKKVVESLFNSMKESNEMGILSCFTSTATMQSVDKDKEGNINTKTTEVGGFASNVGKLPKGAADERITFDVVRIDGDMAFVWTPYQLFFNGKFMHCGVDAFVLIKQNGNWKINYLIDTRRKENCN